MYKKLLLACCLFFLSISAYANEGPLQMLEQTTTEVIDKIKAATAAGKLDINQITEQMIIPHLQMEEIAKWVAGRGAWQAANEKQRQLLIKALKGLVLNTYTNSLEKLSTQTVTFLPSKKDFTGKKRAMIYSVVSSDTEEFRLDYRLMLVEGKWKIYDLVIEGVSLLKGYQTQFYQDIKQNGIESVANKIISNSH